MMLPGQGRFELNDHICEDQNCLREIFRDNLFAGIFQSAAWHNHHYCINCKLSGSVYAASEIKGAIPIVHGPSGCAFHQRVTPMKLYAPIYNLKCTNLNEKDVIYGGEEKLKGTIKRVYDRYHPTLIIILPTCVSGLIGDDIAGICQDMVNELPCNIVYVSSEGFAHRGREALDGIMQNAAKSWKTSLPPDYELRGCGREDVVISLVDQLMEDQDVAENSVNLESHGRLRYGSQIDFLETKRIFFEMGIEINTTILTCTVDQIKRAPAAEINVVMRNRQAASRMKDRFGTEYFRKWFVHYGIDGIERFFIEIASKLGLDGEAEEVVGREKNLAIDRLNKYRHIFKGNNFAISTQGFFFTPYFASIYARDLQIPVKYFCVSTELLKSMNTSKETIELMIKNMEDLFDSWDLGFEMIVNPTLDEISDIAKKVDYVLGDRIMPIDTDKGKGSNVMDISSLNPLLLRSSFSGITDFGRCLAGCLNGNALRPRSLIISRFDYDNVNYPMIRDLRCSASRNMWSEMWSLKGTGGD